MKFSVFAEAYTDGFGAVAVGLGSDATDGGGYPTAVLEARTVKLVGVYNIPSTQQLVIGFTKNADFVAQSGLPVTSIKIVDAVIGTTTIQPGDIVGQSGAGNVIWYATGDLGAAKMTSGERIEVEIDLPDSLILTAGGFDILDSLNDDADFHSIFGAGAGFNISDNENNDATFNAIFKK